MRYALLFCMALSLGYSIDKKIEIYSPTDVKQCGVNDLKVCTKNTNTPITGMVKILYDESNLKREIYFKDGIINGMVKSYYPNGKIELFANYTDGKLDGISKEYYEDGKLKKEMNYSNGKLHGTSKIYYPHEKLQIKILANMNNGEVELYEENGKLKSRAVLDNGNIINQ